MVEGNYDEDDDGDNDDNVIKYCGSGITHN